MVSSNRGTPQIILIFMGFSLVNHPFWGPNHGKPPWEIPVPGLRAAGRRLRPEVVQRTAEAMRKSSGREAWEISMKIMGTSWENQLGNHGKHITQLGKASNSWGTLQIWKLSQMAFLSSTAVWLYFCARSNDKKVMSEIGNALPAFFQALQRFDSSKYGRNLWLDLTRMFICGCAAQVCSNSESHGAGIHRRRCQTILQRSGISSSNHCFPKTREEFEMAVIGPTRHIRCSQTIQQLETFPSQQDPRQQYPRQELATDFRAHGPRAPGYVKRKAK